MHLDDGFDFLGTAYIWKLTYKWACRGHSNKSKCWVVDRYFGRFNRSRNDNRWVLCDRDSGVYLLKFSWTQIVRHQLGPGTASPDDPGLADYWAKPRQRGTPPMDGISLRLLKTQHGRCSVCGGLLLAADHEPQTLSEWAQWLTATRKTVRKRAVTAEANAGPSDDLVHIHLTHTHCRRRLNASAATEPKPLTPVMP